ncbi:MAG: single-stranded-DNA-specific exonuclease RecJ [Tepidisphaeraceae bacterium]
MNQPRRWTVTQPHAGASDLAERLKTSPLVAQILLNRGLSDPQQCSEFLHPSLKCLHEPALIPNLTLAADRIARAIRAGEKIVIYGDYDVDGITATAILWHAIRLLGGMVEYYIPHRIDEGYGLNSEAVAQLCRAGAALIVTVDCGVTAIEPAKVARECNVDLIITDHHDLHETLPECCAIVHPRLGGDYPNPHLCGAGVAFKLAWGIGIAMNGAARVSEPFRAFLMEATALAALGTIADVVPLVGENRVLAHFGLSGLKSSKLSGIRALIASAGLDGQKLDCYHAGFVLAPRLNACGRMGHAALAVELLTDASESRAIEIAKYLDEQNRARQSIEKRILEQALAQVAQRKMDGSNSRAIVLAGEGWHAGVIGIVASRLVDRFHRPAILVAPNDGLGQGSGRSIAGFHLCHALDACGKHLEAYGGHEMAAGLKLRMENFEVFRDAFIEYARATIAPESLMPELFLDGLAELKHVTESVVNEIKRLGPFGHGNRKPLLCCRNVELTAPPRRVGKTGDHLQLFVRQGDTRMKCIAFGAANLLDRLTPGIHIDLAVEPQLNEWNGRRSVELAVKDVQFG